MALTAGIVGLPNVGKSTLFNAITKAGALAANYPFATIEPNVGMVNVPDERLTVLSNMYNPKKTTPAVCEFTDIAGLVKGASKGEGLGNQFLGNIRNCDAILEVVRCFEDANVTHVEGGVDPVRDAEIINLELILSDLAQVENRIPKIEKKAQSKIDDAPIEYALLLKLKELLENEKPARSIGELSDKEQKYFAGYQLLTAKPFMYVANVKEDFIADPEADPNYQKLKAYAASTNAKIIAISAEIEAELAQLEDDEKEMFLADYGVTEPGLNKLVRATYDLLGLATFFTTGPDECRAWTFKKGMLAPQCAGIIHTDFERGFIRAETTAYDDLIKCGSALKAREAGLVRQEGKDYVVKDGDIMFFKFNV
ncbi:MAG: redox-regulated ATPase YchF [Acholeplasmatales bacterium]|nr:redox-regulated ATPase YchF [Acholeplasmatales bacterium]